MNATPAKRWHTRPIALLAVLATLIGLLSACSSSHHNDADASSMASMPAATAVAATGRTASEVALYAAMQSLWQQHMEWTYSAVAAFATGSPGFGATAARLLQNQVDIGDAIKPYYGDAAGTALTTLLKAHINGAVAILQAAKAGNTATENTAIATEYANAQAIGDFLAKANPNNWPQTDMRQMMKTHIDQTLVYATDALKGQYAASITDYAKAETHMIAMGDTLSAGIIAAFPDKFTS